MPSDEHVFLGRTAADCPEVDGTVFVQSDVPLTPGMFVPVRITDTYEYDLAGTVVPPPIDLAVEGGTPRLRRGGPPTPRPIESSRAPLLLSSPTDSASPA